jgi:hypothetical protein
VAPPSDRRSTAVLLRLTLKDCKRFWSKVEIQGVNDCWPWLGCRNRYGYGVFMIRGTTKLAHVIARYLATGDDPAGLYTLHNCPEGDQPGCVNPAHLWLGNQADNIADMIAKGRDRKAVGERTAGARLNTEIVQGMRAEHAAGRMTVAQLARAYGMSWSAVRYAIQGHTWKHV